MKKEIGLISGISVYEDSTHKLVDFWKKLEFKMKDNQLIDKTGYFQGILYPDLQNLNKNSKLSKLGFFY